VPQRGIPEGLVSLQGNYLPETMMVLPYRSCWVAYADWWWCHEHDVVDANGPQALNSICEHLDVFGEGLVPPRATEIHTQEHASTEQFEGICQFSRQFKC